MNKSKVKKYINDLQISIGKLLEEMEDEKSISKAPEGELCSLEASIPEEERNMINGILSSTTKPEPMTEDESEEERKRIANELGIL